MAEVISLVRGHVDEAGAQHIVDGLRAAIEEGLPPFIEETFVMRSGEDEVAIMTLWRSQADLDAMIATGEEPLARRLIREAGGTPEASFHRVVVHGRSGGAA